MTKEEKYDAIVEAWDKWLKEEEGDVWYMLAGHPLASDIQDIIKDDITKVIEDK